MPLSIRLNPADERRLRRIARRRRTSLSQLVRDAVTELIREAEKPARPYEQIADLIGSARGLPSDLSERTGQRFYEVLRKDAKKRS